MINRIRESFILKWISLYLFLTLFLLSVSGYVMIKIYQGKLKHSIIEKQFMKANFIAERIEGFFKKLENTFLFIIRDEIFNKENLINIKNQLENLLYLTDYFYEISLFNPRGKEVLRVSYDNSKSSIDLMDISKSNIFKVISEGQTYYGDFSLTKDLTPSIEVWFPIRRYKERISGIIVGRVKLDNLWRMIIQSHFETKDIIFLLDKWGRLVAHSDPTEVIKQIDFESIPNLVGILEGQEGYFEYKDYKGDVFFTIRKTIEPLGWKLFIQSHSDEVSKNIKQVTWSFTQAIFVILLIGLFFSLFLSKRLIAPIKHLSKEMGKVSKGDFNINIEPKTNDEIGLINRSFNQMVQELRQTRDKYRMIFEDSKDMIFVTSPDGRFIDINRVGLELLGFKNKEDVLKIYAKDTFFNPYDHKRFMNEIKNKLFVKDFETKLKNKDETSVDVLISATCIKDDSGEIINYHGIIKDITLRKKMEEEISTQTKELKTLYELSSILNQTLDFDTTLQRSLEMVSNISGFEIGSIFLYNEGDELLEMSYQFGEPESLLKEAEYFRVGEGVAGKALELRKIIVSQINEYPPQRLIPLLRQEGIKTIVGIPLLFREKRIGVITLLSRSERKLTPREINLLEAIGNQIGLTLENAKLFSETKKAKSEWEETFDAVTDLIIIRDREYRIIRANSAAFKRLGIEAEQMIGRKCFEVFHQMSEPCEGCYITEAILTKNFVSCEREYKNFRGIFRHSVFPIKDNKGEVIKTVEIAREITEEKKKEVENDVLNNINKILTSGLEIRDVVKTIFNEIKRLMDVQRISISVFDESKERFKILSLEKDYESIELPEGVCYSAKGTDLEKVGKTGQPIIVNDLKEGESWIGKRLLDEGIRSVLIFPLFYKGEVIGTINFGSKRTCAFSENIFGILHSIASSLGIFIKNALLLEELKESEEKYRIVVEGALDGVCLIGDDFRFKYVNEKLAEIQGYSRDELIGKDLRDYIDEESRNLIMKRENQIKRGIKVSPHFELNIVRKDGEKRNVEISARRIKDSKGEANIIVILKDITEKKKMEEQLVQSEKLRALGEMASGVAHDFNNALAAILGNTQLLIYTVKEKEVIESLKIIEKVARDSANTVKRLQEFTRRKIDGEIDKVDVNSAINDVIAITKPKWKNELQAKGINIEISTDLKAINNARGNPSELKEVITNLIFNSIEALPQGGRIEIKTFDKNEKVFIEVSDNGIGMNEDVRKKIFEPFFTTKPFTHSGLGLSMSYGIIKRFGGNIFVESEEGKGSIFTIELPAVKVQDEHKSTDNILEFKNNGKKAKILIIEDEEMVRDVISKIVSKEGHEVTIAKDGEEGIRLFKEKRFDIVLTDLGMPGLSGWDVCKIIKNIDPKITIGMITGWGMELNQDRLRDYGVDFLISKPFDIENILAHLKKVIGSKSFPVSGQI